MNKTKRRRAWSWLLLVVVLASGCARKQAQAPPSSPPPPAQPKQNVIVLLPDPEARATAIVVTNPAGAQTLTRPYDAVRVERPDAAPSPPFAIEQAEVRRIFGSVLDSLPAPEAVWLLYFDVARDTLVPESQAEIEAILDAIRTRHSTAISVIGHTDTTADPASNYQLGLRRAKAVADALRARGVDDSALFVSSHGDTDLAVKTPRNVPERRNRRVEVIVR